MSARLVSVLLSALVSVSAVTSSLAASNMPEVASAHSELSHGDSGRLLLAFSAEKNRDVGHMKSNSIPATIGLRGEFDNGRVFWLDRAPNGSVVVGVGYSYRF